MERNCKNCVHSSEKLHELVGVRYCERSRMAVGDDGYCEDWAPISKNETTPASLSHRLGEVRVQDILGEEAQHAKVRVNSCESRRPDVADNQD